MRITYWYAKIRPHVEWVIWITGLLLMATMDPYAESITWCLFERVGISWCPGHGLGHSIAFIARGEWMRALQSHPLGPVAVVILLHRSFSQIYKAFNSKINPQIETI